MSIDSHFLASFLCFSFYNYVSMPTWRYFETFFGCFSSSFKFRSIPISFFFSFLVYLIKEVTFYFFFLLTFLITLCYLAYSISKTNGYFVGLCGIFEILYRSRSTSASLRTAETLFYQLESYLESSARDCYFRLYIYLVAKYYLSRRSVCGFHLFSTALIFLRYSALRCSSLAISY